MTRFDKDGKRIIDTIPEPETEQAPGEEKKTEPAPTEEKRPARGPKPTK